jgi:protein arginine kinase activator
MMTCNICGKKPATVHIVEIDDNQKKEMHLCEDCAREKNIGVPQTLSLNDILSGLIEAQSEKDVPELSGVRCPTCGITYAEFRSGGGLGCARDYEVFRKALMPFLERIHGSARHKGKVPACAGRDASFAQRLAELRQELNRAIEAEEYERAAQVRDMIYELKKERRDGAE